MYIFGFYSGQNLGIVKQFLKKVMSVLIHPHLIPKKTLGKATNVQAARNELYVEQSTRSRWWRV